MHAVYCLSGNTWLMNMHIQVFLYTLITSILDRAHILEVLHLRPAWGGHTLPNLCYPHLPGSDSASSKGVETSSCSFSFLDQKDKGPPSHLGTCTKSSVFDTFCGLLAGDVIASRAHFHLCPCWWFSFRTATVHVSLVDSQFESRFSFMLLLFSSFDVSDVDPRQYSSVLWQSTDFVQLFIFGGCLLHVSLISWLVFIFPVIAL